MDKNEMDKNIRNYLSPPFFFLSLSINVQNYRNYISNERGDQSKDRSALARLL